MQYLNAHDFLTTAQSVPMVDVRSPAEYDKGHIAGALSLPLFTDEERAIVGTLYKQKGKQEAISAGLDIVGPKMRQLAEQAGQNAEEGKLKVYCWRGGMRSQKMAWLFELTGIECQILQGGYKAYRNHLLDQVAKLPKLIILQGATGSGKTEILHELIAKGEQVIDLEGLAHHRGSVFGCIGQKAQPTTMQFQNDLFAFVSALDLDRRVWVESESRTIGSAFLPDPFWDLMNQSTVLQIKVDREARVKRLVKDYGAFDKQDLTDAILRIEKRLGAVMTKQILGLLEGGKLAEVADMLLDYYDKTYNFSSDKHKKGNTHPIECAGGNPTTHAQLLIEQADALQL